MHKVLIVDDEFLARERLSELVLELHPQVDIAEAHNGLDALEKISEFSPDIILLDIRMPGMDGLEVANHVLNLDPPPTIVFTTAYQDHAIKAFDANAVDYLLKPIRKERLKVALERATTINQTKLSNVSEGNTSRKHLSAMVQGNLKLISIENIYYLKAEQKYVTAAWPGGEILIDEPLVSLEAEFQEYFIRTHRNTLVAKKYIESLCKTSEGHHAIKLQGMPIALNISRRHLAEVRSVIKQR